MKKILLLIFVSFYSVLLHAQQRTYCNPLNLDYTYMIYNAHNDISYRSGADPAVVEFRGEYYMFVTRSLGYWHSLDLLHWDFITPQKWYFEGSNAPAAHNYKDSVLYFTGNPSGSMSVLYTDEPKKGDWKAVPAILNNLQDPGLFIDEDGSGYMYWGSSNKFPIRAKTLDKNKSFRPSDKTYELYNLKPAIYGWERFGNNHADTTLGGYIEGPWMTKHKGKYYLQYAAPGTEFNVYGDGAYIADEPLGPYKYMPNNPFSYKPGGFMNGAGHGSTVIGPHNTYWHFASMAVSVNVNWERRLCMYPTWFDNDGLMHSNTYFGDYPHQAPQNNIYNPENYTMSGDFAGWMLLSYKKPVTASSVAENNKPENVDDENVKTFWLAEENDNKQWLMIDLQKISTVHALQINFHDHKSGLYGRVPGLRHRFIVEGSLDGKNWQTLIDKSNSFADVPNDYEELLTPAQARYIRYNNIHVPTINLAISGFRIFGTSTGAKPGMIKKFSGNRYADRRDAMLTWDNLANTQGYNILWGIAPDKLYNSWMIYGDNKLLLKSLSADQDYYFAIEPFNENGIGKISAIIPVK